MSKIKCKLFVYSNYVGVQQIYTGFSLLYKSGLIELKQVFNFEGDSNGIRQANSKHIDAIINDRIRIHYDTHDNYFIDQELLEHTDFYFKRSFYPKYLSSIGDQKTKVFPLGLNYGVYPSHIDRFAIERNFFLSNGINKFLGIFKPFNTNNWFRFSPRVRQMHSFPDFDAEPKILFMVKAFDPYDKPDRPTEKVEERIQINDTRARCIRLLKKEFKSNFYGGFYHTIFANEHYKDCLIPDRAMSTKRNYISLLKSYPICIANSGLHGSIGWKFAEYVAFSKAIIAEKMTYEIPGNLEIGKNYLEFQSAEDCLDMAAKLFKDKLLRNNIMANNTKYYHSYLKPDNFVLRTILTALSYHN